MKYCQDPTTFTYDIENREARTKRSGRMRCFQRDQRAVRAYRRLQVSIGKCTTDRCWCNPMKDSRDINVLVGPSRDFPRQHAAHFSPPFTSLDGTLNRQAPTLRKIIVDHSRLNNSKITMLSFFHLIIPNPKVNENHLSPKSPPSTTQNSKSILKLTIITLYPVHMSRNFSP